MYLYFGREDAERFVSAEQILSGSVPADVLRDKLVLVGITGLGLLDYQVTPLGERIPGVEVHAQILEQIFDGGVRVTSLDGAWGNGWTLELRQRPWAEIIPGTSRHVLPKVGCGGLQLVESADCPAVRAHVA